MQHMSDGQPRMLLPALPHLRQALNGHTQHSGPHLTNPLAADSTVLLLCQACRSMQRCAGKCSRHQRRGRGVSPQSSPPVEGCCGRQAAQGRPLDDEEDNGTDQQDHSLQHISVGHCTHATHQVKAQQDGCCNKHCRERGYVPGSERADLSPKCLELRDKVRAAKDRQAGRQGRRRGRRQGKSGSARQH